MREPQREVRSTSGSQETWRRGSTTSRHEGWQRTQGHLCRRHRWGGTASKAPRSGQRCAVAPNASICPKKIRKNSKRRELGAVQNSRGNVRKKSHRSNSSSSDIMQFPWQRSSNKTPVRKDQDETEHSSTRVSTKQRKYSWAAIDPIRHFLPCHVLPGRRCSLQGQNMQGSLLSMRDPMDQKWTKTNQPLLPFTQTGNCNQDLLSAPLRRTTAQMPENMTQSQLGCICRAFVGCNSHFLPCETSN